MAQDFLAELALVIDLPHCEQQFLDLLHLAQNLACLLLVCPLQEEQRPIAGDVFFPLQLSHFMSFTPFNPRLYTAVDCGVVGRSASMSAGLGACSGAVVQSGNERSPVSFQSRRWVFNLRALAITETELRLIAALAIIGLSRSPNTG